MLGLSTSHMVILGFVALLFGGKRLPVLGASLGQGMRSFKDALEGKHGRQLPGPVEEKRD